MHVENSKRLWGNYYRSVWKCSSIIWELLGISILFRNDYILLDHICFKVCTLHQKVQLPMNSREENLGRPLNTGSPPRRHDIGSHIRIGVHQHQFWHILPRLFYSNWSHGVDATSTMTIHKNIISCAAAIWCRRNCELFQDTTYGNASRC